MASGRQLKGLTLTIDGDTTGLSKALSGINKDIKDTQAQLKDVEKLLKLDPGNTELLSQKQRLLTDAIGETKEKLETLKTASEEANKALEDGAITQDQYDALQREIVETSERLQDLERQAEEAKSALTRIAEAGGKLKEIGGKIEGVGKKIMPVSAVVTAAGTAAASKFAEVDKTMQLTNATMGNTEEQAKLLDKAMAEAAANSVFGMGDAATATLNFARAGLTAEEAAAALAPAMNLAAGEGGNLDTVSGGLVATINGFHGSFDEAGRYADVFAAACNNSALDVNSLSDAMSVAAPIFSAAGMTVEDAALYMGTMANNGIDANVAANSLKTGLARLVKPAKEGSEMMDQLGISVTNADGTMKDSITIQRELHDVFANLSEAEQIAAASAIFGKNQMAPWLALINTAPEDVGALDESLRNCARTTDEMAEAMMSGFGGSIEQLKSSIDVLMTQLGQLIAEAILPVIQKIIEWVTAFNNLDEGTKRVIVQIGMVIAALGPALIIIGKIISAVGTIMTLAPAIGTAITAVKGAVSELFAVLAANPIGIVIAAITALVAAFIHFWNTSESFREFWINLWEGIKQAAVTAWNGIKGFLSGAWGAIMSVASTAWSGIKSVIGKAWEGIKTNTGKAIDAIKTNVPKAWDKIKTVTGTAWNAIRTNVSSGMSAVGNAISTGWNNAKTTVSGALSTIANNVSESWNATSNLVSKVMQGISTGLSASWSNIVTGVSGAMRNVFSAVSNGFRSVISFITGLPSQAIRWGSDLIGGIIRGIGNAFGGLVNSVRNVANTIRRFLHFSVPDEGPLTDYESWMPDFMKGLAVGIEKSRGLVKAAVNDVSKDLMLQPSFTATGSMADAPRSGNGGESISSMLQEYLPYLPQMAKSQWVTDTGVLVGELVPEMNRRLGTVAMRERRQ